MYLRKIITDDGMFINARIKSIFNNNKKKTFQNIQLNIYLIKIADKIEINYNT